MKILLIHGAFSGAWAWEPVLPGLRAAGHDVRAIDLPGGGSDRTPLDDVSLEGYAERICETLTQAGEPVVLVGHSMGGMAVTQAAARCPKRVAGLAYVAAFVPQAGESLMDLTRFPEAAGEQVGPHLTLYGDPPTYAGISAAGSRAAFRRPATDEQAAWAAARRGPEALAPMAQPFTLPGIDDEAFDRLPRAYVTTLRDRAVRPALQRVMYTRAGCDPVIEIDTDHSPQLTATGELVAALDRIAQHVTTPAHRPARRGWSRSLVRLAEV